MRVLFLFLFIFVYWTTSYAEVWIVAPKNFAADTISAKDLRRLYLGYLNYLDGKRVILTQIEGNALKQFLERHIHVDLSNYQQKWYSKIFTGKGELPKQFKNDKDLINFIKTTDQSLGFITDKSQLDGDVKILTVKD